MKRVLLVFLVLSLPLAAMSQKPKKSQPAPVKAPTVLSVGEILATYGLDSAWVNDTAAAIAYLDGQPEDFVALTNLCVSIRTKAQSAISSIENDYEFRDSLIWLDSNTVLADYPIYEFRLRRLADLMGKLSIRYSRLEQQRIEAEREAARQRALEEARRQQEERNRIAADLRSNIELHHRAIIDKCDGAGISDKAKLKELKDLYYSYLMVYNKYDLSVGKATNESIAKLDELNAFQNDLLENVLGNNSLPFQIENFKNVLKVRCEKENSDLFRSYSKVFKLTSVPVSFADVKEYEEYINRMRTVINVQQRYMQAIDLRAAIAAGSDAINNHYGKKYRQVLGAYRDVLKGLNQTPAFTTNAESLLFIQSLEDFIAAQQLYVDFFSQLEEISQRSDSIMKRGTANKQLYDVVVAYREVNDNLIPLPSFRDPQGALVYQAQLDDVRQVQQCYMDVLSLRSTIARNDDSITSVKKLDRTLANGYKLLRKQADLRPSFATVERGRSFIDMLNAHIDMQRLCLSSMQKLDLIKRKEALIDFKENPYRNIVKAYSRLYKAYSDVAEITNLEDLRRFSRQCDRIINLQEAFIEALKSPSASDIDSSLKRESSIDKIKLVVGIK